MNAVMERKRLGDERVETLKELWLLIPEEFRVSEDGYVVQVPGLRSIALIGFSVNCLETLLVILRRGHV